MVRITVNDDLLSQLGQSVEPVELCDPSGRVMGSFYPDPRLRPGSLRELSPFTEEELDRRSKEPGGRPLEDILRDLSRR